MNNKYINVGLCSSCGGKCCKSMGCHFSPDDFEEVSYDYLKRKIDEDHISIDWWEGDPTGMNKVSRGYFLRIRNIDSPIVDPSFGGVCSILTDNGCPLKFEERPKGGRLLVPNKQGCLSKYDKKKCALDWIKYYDILDKLYDEYYSDPSIDDLMKNLFGFF